MCDLRFHARDIKHAFEVYEGDFGQNPGLHLQDGGCNRYPACLLTNILALVSIVCDGLLAFIRFRYLN